MKLELCAGNELAVRMAHQLSFARIELCQQLESYNMAKKSYTCLEW